MQEREFPCPSCGSHNLKFSQPPAGLQDLVGGTCFSCAHIVTQQDLDHWLEQAALNDALDKMTDSAAR